jgi:hypothetical protein
LLACFADNTVVLVLFAPATLWILLTIIPMKASHQTNQVDLNINDVGLNAVFGAMVRLRIHFLPGPPKGLGPCP